MPLLRRPRALTPDGFYGWHIVVFAAITLTMSAPGQTVGISLFIDPLIADLGISRSMISTSYLIGTVTGAFALPWVGRAIDRYGTRRVLLVIGFVFGAILMAMSLVSSIVGLTAGFVGVRMAGQGALALTSTTVVAHWFEKRRGLAGGLAAAFGVVGMSSAPLLLEGLIADVGWRSAWLIEGAAVWAVVLPIALLGIRDRPADLGQEPDGATLAPGSAPRPAGGLTRAQALRHPYFWLVTCALATSAMLGTAVAFHQISLLTSHGLTATEAAANFLPQTVAGLVATLAGGWLMDRFGGRLLLVSAMGMLAGALVWATVVSPGWSALGFGMALGVAQNIARAVENTGLPNAFGVRHIGAIRGVVSSVGVAASAVGPLLFAAVFDTTGGYGPALVGSAVVPVGIGIWAALTAEPHVPATRHAPVTTDTPEHGDSNTSLTLE
ncbi:MFS transporter [Myceligenerans salitolerans]|uniref:MFS transporter n=1 Tax=Myceligenerans salitolerans TaxID=1230528 RepID=A0ABS3I9V3_9MICO|nr:MFS transporter [Myceligenerans salitolerans]MBO0609134.1 MFS transporter [Myceligenerans salitolerans]